MNSQPNRRISIFSVFAKRCAEIVGKSTTFALACTLLLIWACCGPYFEYSDTWQLVINTGTTIITFLTVFLIQNTQNRDSETVQIKLDEIIKVLKEADNRLLDVEEDADQELHLLYENYKELGRKAKNKETEQGNHDGNCQKCCSNQC
ncbi:MAG: low affinity iron permease family protein [Cyanobacteria bacterium TGS_CYA1]|nr:low affinity iron permease family protein [Cyanobacteria bacterium TGS_CYA1]